MNIIPVLYSITLMFICSIRNHWHLLIPNSHPSLPYPISATTSLFSYLGIFLFHRCVHCLVSFHKGYCLVFVFFWLTSLRMIISGPILIAANGIISFFFMADWYFIVRMYHVFFIADWYFIVRMYHVFFIRSSVNGQLGCFHVLAIANRATVNTRMQVSFWIIVLSRYVLRSGMARSYGSSVFSIWRISILFSIVSTTITSPPTVSPQLLTTQISLQILNQFI